MENKKWNIDVPVYLIFFNRPDTFKYVFEAVRRARPSKLFLACDGARENRTDDEKNVEECKKIAENIDWECEVYKNYSDENLGCGFRMYSGINWAFEYVDRLIILEDDCVPHQDFFKFCYELLEYYKDDNRIYMINGMNRLGIYDKTPYSYFFSGGNCWGWATWKRAWKNVEYDLKFMEDEYSMHCVEERYPYYYNAVAQGEEKLNAYKNGKKLSAWTYQSGMACALNSQLCITPKKNLITNIGLLGDSGHTTNDIRKVAKKFRAYYNAPVYDVDFPLKHPKYIIEDMIYYKMETRRFKVTVFSTVEGILRRIIFAQKGDIKKMINKIPKKLGLKRKNKV